MFEIFFKHIETTWSCRHVPVVNMLVPPHVPKLSELCDWSPDDPEDALSEAAAERGGGGGEPEGGAVPPHPERAAGGEGDQQPAAEAGAGPKPAEQVRTHTRKHTHGNTHTETHTRKHTHGNTHTETHTQTDVNVILC